MQGDVRILNPAIIVGRPLDKLLEKGGAALLAVLLSTFKLSRYIVLPCGSALNVVLHHDARPRDICQVYLQACLLRRRMRQDPSLGQAAALHDCYVERLKSNSASGGHMSSGSSGGGGSGRREDCRAKAAGVSHPETPASTGSSSSSSCSGISNNSDNSSQGRDASWSPWENPGDCRCGDVLTSTESGSSRGSSSSRLDLALSDSSGTDISSRGASSRRKGCDSRLEPNGNNFESSSTSGGTGSDSGTEAGTSTSYGASPCGAGAPLADSCDAGAPLAGNSGAKGEGMEVTWYNAPGIFGVSSDNSDPKFWVASTGASSTSLAELRIALQDTLQTAERLTTPFMAALESSGWQLGKIVVEANRRRARW
ncbi:hypothetical protein DUNSADRAFT_15951 [Dunaliella salina]|uniref:Uncharacterized protein n=1 Tax=Dunaliella salina TaxID=3046 RepID=A0ABQ7G4J6_DUNSA|nr:hypothetical protein DUNSADRAFT_15951 [Dunaliella salina]|eukprot:KAF5829533.1 hypothetical protein DUNSADRAFT_15951 [Dunaliella salina]